MKDANNNLVTLTFGLCESENKENWVKFNEIVNAAFKGMKLLITDKAKGLESFRQIQNNTASRYINNNVIATPFAACVRHAVTIITNNADALKYSTCWAKAPTESLKLHYLSQIKNY